MKKGAWDGQDYAGGLMAATLGGHLVLSGAPRMAGDPTRQAWR